MSKAQQSDSSCSVSNSSSSASSSQSCGSQKRSLVAIGPDHKVSPELMRRQRRRAKGAKKEKGGEAASSSQPSQEATTRTATTQTEAASSSQLPEASIREEEEDGEADWASQHPHTQFFQSFEINDQVIKTSGGTTQGNVGTVTGFTRDGLVSVMFSSGSWNHWPRELHKVPPKETGLPPIHRSDLRYSKGSELHHVGQCLPCAWYLKAVGCNDGAECVWCHACDEIAVAKWRLKKNRAKRERARQRQREEQATEQETAQGASSAQSSETPQRHYSEAAQGSSSVQSAATPQRSPFKMSL